MANDSKGKYKIWSQILAGTLNRTVLLVILLVFYITLFVGTGYYAFKDNGTASSDIAQLKKDIEQIQPWDEMDASTKREISSIITARYKSSIDGVVKKNELAAQAFNVVLGAIIGFLSAAVTYMFTPSGGEEDDNPPVPTNPKPPAA